jgi:hypothetical protein
MVPMKQMSGTESFRQGLNFLVFGLAIIVFPLMFKDELYHFFLIGSPELIAFLSFLVGSVLTGFGAMLTVAGLLRKSKVSEFRAIIPQIVILVILVIALLILAIRSDRLLPSLPVPAGPISI